MFFLTFDGIHRPLNMWNMTKLAPGGAFALRTSGAFHTKCMEPARSQLLSALKDGMMGMGLDLTWRVPNSCMVSKGKCYENG